MFYGVKLAGKMRVVVLHKHLSCARSASINRFPNKMSEVFVKGESVSIKIHRGGIFPYVVPAQEILMQRPTLLLFAHVHSASHQHALTLPNGFCIIAKQTRVSR